MASHTVVKGECLWSIAEKYFGSGLKWTALADLNGISRSNPIIYVGQIINLDISGSSTPDPKNNTSTPTIAYFGLQAGTDKSVFATWTWDKTNTDNYKTMWYYATGDGVWFVGNDSSVEYKQSVYTAPSNATKVKFKVKPIAKTHKVNNTDTAYWTANWSTEKTYDFSNNPPTTPPVPTVTIDKYQLTAELSNLDVNGTSIQFQIVKNDSTVFKTGTANIVTSSASYSCTVDAGAEYKVRCRACRDKSYSDWSDYSSNVGTIPAAPSSITTCKANSETSVYLVWTEVKTATSYTIEYTTKHEYFDGSDQTSTVTGIEFTHYEKTGLTSGEQYFFRVRAENDQGESGWSEIKSVKIGKAPVAPTTWSSTTTVVTGESLTLYWVHNAEDGSSETYAELEMYIDGVKETHTIRNSLDDSDRDATSWFSIDTSSYKEGTQILWRVRTAGITNEYGDWSVQRTVDVYAPATLSLSVTDSNANHIDTLASFPCYISALAGPNTQQPIGYHVTVTANESYETVDQVGNTMFVGKGSQVYSKYFDISDSLLVELSAGNIDLENNIDYTVTCIVSMNSGLTAEATSTFTVAWSDIEYEPNAEIGIDEDTLTAHIRPYCEDENGDLISGLSLSVYRREYDGTFIELATGLKNTSKTFITDPHPALDFARYRIVAIDDATGAVSYCDLPGYPIGEKSVVIQWDEEWSYFDVSAEDTLEQPPWSGSQLKLPYNIDVSDKNTSDVSLVEYIGRAHPISYYGTQLGTTSSWKMDIDKSDKETLYALRRLAIWLGDVYVREPSGSGYWANISVSFSQTHRVLTIPVTIDIRRVEGGI